jgi:hypothetical protein
MHNTGDSALTILPCKGRREGGGGIILPCEAVYLLTKRLWFCKISFFGDVYGDDASI